MHPAPSVIAFTTLSGLGLGLLAWLGLGFPDVTGGWAFAMYFLGYALTVGGLLSSTLHLGKPSNAVKAFSQWRTSWLSREAVAAVAALLVVAPFAIGRIFLGGAPGWLGVVGALLCLATVLTTSMIYTQLRTVPRWNQPITPVLFLAYAVAGGAVLVGLSSFAALLLALAAVLQIVAWASGDERFQGSGSTLGTAIGLGSAAKVRQLEAPHSGGNYLLTEMAYRVGRKHAVKLRVIGIGLAFVLPVLFLTLIPSVTVRSVLAVLSHLGGVMVTRWLFFAEAEHVVSIYYDRAA